MSSSYNPRNTTQSPSLSNPSRSDARGAGLSRTPKRPLPAAEPKFGVPSLRDGVEPASKRPNLGPSQTLPAFEPTRPSPQAAAPAAPVSKPSTPSSSSSGQGSMVQTYVKTAAAATPLITPQDRAHLTAIMEKINANATILSRFPEVEKATVKLIADKKDLAGRLAELSTEVKEKTAALETATADSRKSAEDLERVRVELQATQKQLVDIRAESAAHAEREAELTKRVAQLTADTEALRTQNITLTDERDALLDTEAKLRVENAELRTRDAARVTENARLRTENAALVTEKAGLVTENARLYQENVILRQRAGLSGDQPVEADDVKPKAEGGGDPQGGSSAS